MTMPLRLAVLATGLVLFAVLHSLLAAPAVRTRLARLLGAHRYRLAYNLFAIGSLALPFVLTRGPFPTVWEATGGLAVMLRLLQGAAVVLFLVALRPVDLGHFTGLRQLRGHQQERGGLQSGGAYALCRHPLYLAVCVFVTAAPRMDARGLVVALWLWAYAYLGAWVEERKLHAQFAGAYRRYCATTPRLVPRLPRRRRAVAPMPRRKETR